MLKVRKAAQSVTVSLKISSCKLVKVKELIEAKPHWPTPSTIYSACQELQIPESSIQYWEVEAIIRNLDRRGYKDFAKSLENCLIKKKS